MEAQSINHWTDREVQWRKAVTDLGQRAKKQRHRFANKGPPSQSDGFSSTHVWMWKLDYKESWAPNNWCFWTMVWRRLLRVPWAARRSNQSILKEISSEYSLEGLIWKLKLQYFGHLMRRTDSLEKTLMLGKTEGGKRRGRQRMRCLDGSSYSTDVNLGKLQEMVKNREPRRAAVHGVAESDMTERLNWSKAFYSHGVKKHVLWDILPLGLIKPERSSVDPKQGGEKGAESHCFTKWNHNIIICV